MRDWSTWPEEYYKTTDPEERYEILTERLESGEAEEKDQIRMKFWELRYAKRDKMPEGVDYFIRSWMDLFYMSRKPGKPTLVKKQRKELETIKQDLGFVLAKEYGVLGEEVLYEELCHGVTFYMSLCEKDTRYSSQLLGFMKLKQEALVEKIGEEVWRISKVIPEVFAQEEEFAIFAKACKDSFWKRYPKFKKDEAIKLER